MEELSNATELVNAIVQLRERAEAATKAAEEANSKANSESAFAYNAKQNAEDHAKAISQIHGTVDAEIAGLATTKKNAEEAASAITVLKATADADARIVSEKRAAIENEATATQAASERGTAALVAIEQARSEVAAALNAVTSGAAAVALAKTNSDTALASIQTSQTQSAEIAAKAANDGAVISKIESDANSLFKSLNKALVSAKEAQERVTAHEKQLTELMMGYEDLNKKIEGLLPNATSAGLASAFRIQKKRFQRPQLYWLVTFVFTIILLLIVGIVGSPLVQADGPSGAIDTWDAILRHIAVRLPLIVPLVWLGIYAGRNYMLALRVEEEYAFKEAVSTAFEGYKREMANIPAVDGNAAPPLVVLCENVLRALAQRPGRIYEGRHEDITPLSPVRGIFGLKKTDDATKTTGPSTE